MKTRIATVDKTKEILCKYKINPKQRYGQNFMVSPKIPSLIASNDLLTKDTLVIEIGPGVGALTQFLLERVSKVIVIEIDTALSNIIKETLCDYKNLEVHNKDFLKFDLDSIDYDQYSNVVFVSNLPYYITSEILTKLLKYENNFSIIAMMQKEVATRILNGQSKDINDLVLFSRLYSDVSKISDVSKNDFFPKPSVDSSVLLFKKKNIEDKYYINKYIDILFKQRRKTIYNNLKYLSNNGDQLDSAFIKSILKQADLTDTARIDDLNFEQFNVLIESIKSHCLIKPNAKINLGLKVLNKEGNTHLIKTIYLPISLYDCIEFYITEKEFAIQSDVTIENNNLYSVVEYVKRQNNSFKGCFINIHKFIPIQSGLGGGSSDYVFLYKHLCNYYHNEIDNGFIKKGGEDCLFFDINKQTIYENKKHSLLETNLKEYSVLLVNINNGVSTKECFSKFEEKFSINNKKYDYSTDNFKNIFNDLEDPAISLRPEIGKLLNDLKKYSFSYVGMTGSGSCVYCLDKNKRKLSKAVNNLKEKYPFVKIVDLV